MTLLAHLETRRPANREKILAPFQNISSSKLLTLLRADFLFKPSQQSTQTEVHHPSEGQAEYAPQSSASHKPQVSDGWPHSSDFSGVM